MLSEIGHDIPEDKIAEDIWEADPKGQGFVGLEAFIKTISN
jgi:Ca2+-binding EF-hand superfamily protein